MVFSRQEYLEQIFLPSYTDRASLVAQQLNCLLGLRETRVWSLGREDPLKKELATHSSTLAWRIPWMEEPGRLQSMGSQRDTIEQLHFHFHTDKKQIKKCRICEEAGKSCYISSKNLEEECSTCICEIDHFSQELKSSSPSFQFLIGLICLSPSLTFLTKYKRIFFSELKWCMKVFIYLLKPLIQTHETCKRTLTIQENHSNLTIKRNKTNENLGYRFWNSVIKEIKHRWRISGVK